MQRFTRSFIVRWADCDANGHLRNTCYSEYAIEVRMAFLAQHAWGDKTRGTWPDSTPDGIARQSLEYYRQRGLGGLVCNVSFKNYLRSDEHWARLLTAVKACRDLGLVVWIYDELGYPSGGAGGLVLAQNKEFEAQELAYDSSLADPFVLRAAYEHKPVRGKAVLTIADG